MADNHQVAQTEGHPADGDPPKHQIVSSYTVAETDSFTSNESPLRIILFNSEFYTMRLNTGADPNMRVYNLSGVSQRTWFINKTPKILGDLTGLSEGGGEIYVGVDTNSIIDQIAVYNTTGTLLRQWDVPSGTANKFRLQSIWYDSSELYVTSLLEARIDVFNTTGTLQRTFSTSPTPRAIMVFGSEVFVSVITGGQALIEVYSTTGTLQRTLLFNDSPPPLTDVHQFDNDGTFLIAGCDVHGVYIIDPADGAIQETSQRLRLNPSSQQSPRFAGGVAFEPSSGNIYATNTVTGDDDVFAFSYPRRHQSFAISTFKNEGL